MAEEITKAELNAMIDVQAKSAEHLAHIAKSLSDIVAREEKIYNRLYNGLSKEIKDDVIVVDFNHQLAGKKLTFWIKVVKIEK